MNGALVVKERKPIIELEHGVKRQGDTIFVTATHPTWPGLRGSQAFVPMTGGMLVSIKTMDNSQRGALGLPRKGEAE